MLECGPIGLSVVGEVAIIYMEDFQMRAKSTECPELEQWPWYVDDSVLKCRRNRAEEILQYINSIEPEAIKFTKEEEEDGKLAVLDLESSTGDRKEFNSMSITKKTTRTLQ